MNIFQSPVIKRAANCCFCCLLRACQVDDCYVMWIKHAPFYVRHYETAEYREMQHFFKDIPNEKVEIIKDGARMMLAQFGKVTVSHDRVRVLWNVPTNINGLDEKIEDGFKTGRVYAIFKNNKTAKTCDWILSTVIDATVGRAQYPQVGVITTSNSPQYLKGNPLGVIQHKIIPHPECPVLDSLSLANIAVLLEKGPNVRTIIVDHILRIFDLEGKGDQFDPSIGLWLGVLATSFGNLDDKTVILVVNSESFKKFEGPEDQLRGACQHVSPNYQVTTIFLDNEDPSKWSVKDLEHPAHEEYPEAAL